MEALIDGRMLEEYRYLENSFEDPDGYVEPDIDNLTNDFIHPEMNSTDLELNFSKYVEPTSFLPVYFDIDVNEDGLIVMASNNFNTHIYDGVIGATYDFDDYTFDRADNAKIFLKLMDNITKVKFLNNSSFVACTSDNKISMYNVNEVVPARSSNLASSHHYTYGSVKCIEKLQGSNSIVTGSSNGHLDIFNYDSACLYHASHLPSGHLSEINGLSSHSSSENLWVSVSEDRSCVLWDKNEIRPASFLLADHPVGFSDVIWLADNVIIMSDYSGNLITIDPRNPNVIVTKDRVSERNISRLEMAKDRNTFGVVSDSSVLKVYRFDGKLECIHEFDANPVVLYSMAWDSKNENTYYAVGESKFAKKVTIV